MCGAGGNQDSTASAISQSDGGGTRAWVSTSHCDRGGDRTGRGAQGVPARHLIYEGIREGFLEEGTSELGCKDNE